jgi:hypothetical protein
MAAWLIPAMKAVLPYVTPIVTAALPVFTPRKSDEAAAQSSVLQQQIDELQAAASQNALHVKELAEQLQKTVTALGQDAALAEKRLRQAVTLAAVAALFALVALGLAVALLVSR